MAIAKTELKKNDADDASTGGSKDTFTGGEGTSLTADEGYPVNSLSKMYRLYSNIKGFAFDMPEGWDDMNISIFLQCFRESIEDFERNHGNNDNMIWHKIAKSGAEKSGGDKSGKATCFTVNSCIELAQCLKDYVIRNKKNVDNEAFKVLYDDIKDLLRFFPDSAKNTNKNVRHRSRSKSAEKKEAYSKNSPAAAESEPPAVAQKDQQVQPASTHQIENLVIKYCLQNMHLFGKPKTPIKSVWKTINHDIFNAIGIEVDVKKELEWIKRKIKKEVNKEEDKKIRAKKFLILANDYIEFFDYMPPRTVKKKDFLGVDDVYLKDDKDNNDGNFASKTESTVSNVNVAADVEYVHKKRRFSKTIVNDVTTKETVSLTSPQNPPDLMKEANQPKTITESGASSDEAHNSDVLKSNSSKSGEATQNYTVQDDSAIPGERGSNVDNPLSTPPSNTEKFQFPNKLPDQIADDHSTHESKDSDNKTEPSKVVSDLNIETTTWVKEVSPYMPGSDVPSKTSEMGKTSYSGNINDQLRIEEDPEAVFFETKYTLRGVRDNVKCYKPRPRKPRKPRSKVVQNTEKFEKRIMPQRSVRRKTKSYKVSDEETSLSPIVPNTQYCPSPKRTPSPEVRGFPAESSSSPTSPPALSPAMKVKRPYNRKTKLVDSSEEMSDDRITSRKEPIPRIPKKRTYQPVDKNPIVPAYMNYRRNKTADQFSEIQSQDSTEDETQYLEKVFGLTRKNVDSEEESRSSKRNPGQMFKTNNRPQIESYVVGRRQADLPKFVSGIHAETHREIGLGHGTMSKGGSNLSPANTYCPDSDSGSAEAYRPSSGSSGHLQGSTSAKSATLKSIQEQVNMLDTDAASSLALIEKYKNRVGEPSQQFKVMTQLVPSSPSVINKTSTVCKPVHHPSTSHSNGLDVISSPPEWFRKFCNDYKKHNMWKWSQLMKMHQDMNGLESKKVEVLEKILEILERDKS